MPEPTVQFASTQPTPVTIYEEELNVVNTDVVVTFNEPNTDPTVAGEDLWQMQVWFSKAEDGQGSSIGMIEAALTEEQANKPIDFSDFTFEVKNYDLFIFSVWGKTRDERSGGGEGGSGCE